MIMGKAARRNKELKKMVEDLDASLFHTVTAGKAAKKCFEHFGRGVLNYLPNSCPIYTLLPHLFNETDFIFLQSYDPDKEFILSRPLVDLAIGKATPKAYESIPFVTSVCSIKSIEGDLVIRYPIDMGLDNPSDVKSFFNIVTKESE